MERILVISPNPWGNLHISKHNYAIALLELGYEVYFMNPPNQDSQVKDFKIEPLEGFTNLYVINSYLWNNKFIDFARWRLAITQIYDWLLLKLVKRICKKKQIKFFQVWNFDPNLHGFMHQYKSSKKIFFIADQITHKTSLRNGSKVNAVVSVANEILAQFKPINNNCLLINHGLSKHYEQFGKQRLDELKSSSFIQSKPKRIQIGYIGNLLMPFVDEKILKQIITDNTDVDFHFWGAYTADKKNNLLNSFNSEIYDTVQWIHKNCNNTFFYGIQKPEQIVPQLHDIDAFIYINNPYKDVNGGANSHKILEYLSTGKVIISTYLSYYSQTNLFPMLPKGNEGEFANFFADIIHQLPLYNAAHEQAQRIEFALNHTYKKNILTIQSFLQNT